MAAPLIPQEVYLLERYSSRDYFEQLVDAFAGCVEAAEHALVKFMLDLPLDYRSKPLWQQPDATWGEVVLPNLRSTLESLNRGLIQISNGDMSGLTIAGGVGSDFAALGRDYDVEWMPEPELSDFDACMRLASRRGSNIFATAQRWWLVGNLTTNYQSETRGDLDAPPTWPIYRLVPSVHVVTGATVPRSGIYLPDRAGSSAQFLINGYDAPKCAVSRQPGSGSAARDLFDSTWVLVERSADAGGVLFDNNEPVVGPGLRCVAGSTCPQAGWWITPAGERSRRKFAQGENMPAMAGVYGVTIWQWSADQAV